MTSQWSSPIRREMQIDVIRLYHSRFSLLASSGYRSFVAGQEGKLMLPSAGKGSLANMALVAHLKDALALELKKVKTEVQQSLRAKQNETLALKKEAARKSTTISGLEEVNEKRKDQIAQMKALIQPLRDALVDQGVELAHLNTEAEELRRKVSRGLYYFQNSSFL